MEEEVEMKKLPLIIPAIVMLAACGSNHSGGGASASNQIKIVGSSTVYPFTTAVAESFQRDNPGTSVIVESTGTGAGMKLFCQGIGGDTPDMTDASRPIKKSEFEMCVKNGAKQIIEVPVGIDGLTFIQNKGAPALSLTTRDIYMALAANPFGKPNTAKTWHDVNPALPPQKIRVMGPPPTSGTRDSLAELILAKGCETDPAMKALKTSDEQKQKDLCTKIREDGAYIEAGENDNLLVQKVAVDNDTLGVLGFSYLDENADKVKAVKLGGVSPTETTIADLTYPGSRKLFIYVKGEHLALKPRMKDFLAGYAKLWGKGGLLEKRGLVPLAGSDLTAAAAKAIALTPLDGSSVK
jgi:phosphate transport system substrate-binding protein